MRIDSLQWVATISKVLAVLNVVLFHCHFDRGGVTQVVLNQINSLLPDARVDRIILVSGPRISGLPKNLHEKVSQFTLEGLDYDSGIVDKSDTAEQVLSLSHQLLKLFTTQGLSPDDTVLHWHNHSLGKNTALPGVIQFLAKSSWRTLLQIHDFAEDYRPRNYRAIVRAIDANDRASVDAYLYPIAEQIRYCTLTRLDAKVLVDLGVPEERVDVLPNNVDSHVLPQGFEGCEQEDRLKIVRKVFRLPEQSRWCVYPVRGIRRKNLGEFLLLSELNCKDRFSAVTLRPTTSSEAASYDRWRSLAKEIAPRAIFDAGHRENLSFEDNLLASDYVISTSAAEGFGMAFLEPWLMGKGVVARRLENVIPDLEMSGVNFPNLYRKILIPGNRDWIMSCRLEWERAFEDAWDGLPKSMKPAGMEKQGSTNALFESDSGIDFALLSTARQIEVLHRFRSDSGFQADVRSASSRLIESLSQPEDTSTIIGNSERIRKTYDGGSMRQRLLRCYIGLLHSGVESEISTTRRAGEALGKVLQRQPFYPCRIEEGFN